MDPLKTRKLGSTGIELTELAVGTWGLCADAYGKVYPEQQARTLARAVEQGVRTFDMAPIWGEDGGSERAVAEAVGARRDEMVYVTRAGLMRHELGTEPAFTGTVLRAQCEASLGRLKTTHLDVWLLHNPSEADLKREEVRDTAEALVREGKVRAWGASVSHIDDARAALEAGAQVLCVPFNLLAPSLFWDLANDVGARSVGVLARSVLLYGMLAGRWSPKKRFVPDDHRTQRWSPEALGERVQQVSERRNLVHGPVLSMASAALRFVLAHDVVSCAIVGPRTPGQVEASIQALAGEPYLPAEELEHLRKTLR